jgi:hypothetical protein
MDLTLYDAVLGVEDDLLDDFSGSEVENFLADLISKRVSGFNCSVSKRLAA